MLPWNIGSRHRHSPGILDLSTSYVSLEYWHQYLGTSEILDLSGKIQMVFTYSYYIMNYTCTMYNAQCILYMSMPYI